MILKHPVSRTPDCFVSFFSFLGKYEYVYVLIPDTYRTAFERRMKKIGCI